ncbi:Chitinase 2 [Coemansia guatemalensis]|uniref:chitinase n=1 Tax=Coemansia guatemalensis TaxID=2761395 RepID=A0A9W8LT97_9FUNG|nr:Chitinase 2 [Coemansia guatemalensis]
MLRSTSSSVIAALVAFAGYAISFDVSCNSNYVSYYGQNSARNQKSLGEYCKDATEDLIVLAFMNGFPNILLNFANACETTFDGSTLLHCPSMAKDIEYCQSQGKAVILSMGGASGAYGFGSESDGTQFADTVWNMFMKGNAAQRPFDDAVLDGIDLDIEGGGGTGYVSFIEQLRSHYSSDTSKKYYIAAAPQCPYPDAYLGSTLNSAWFDMVYVQFYNNFCGLNAYPNWFNFEDWDNWAKKNSINKDVKVYIGAPGSPSAASSGYVDGSTLTSIYNNVRSKYSSLGGIMTWDVSQARTSGIANSIRSALDNGGTCRKPGGGGEPTTSTNTGSSSSTSESSSSSQYSTSSSTSESNSESSTDENPESPDTTTDMGLSTVVTTATETITSVSTFVTSIFTEVTTESTFTSYLTTVYTLTQSGEDYLSSNAQSSIANTEGEESVKGMSFSSADETADNSIEIATNTNPASDKCPVEGAPCVESMQGCNSVGYALCVNGRWSVYPCFSGTTCYLQGSAAICDWEREYGRDPCNVQPIQRNPSKSTAKMLSALKPDLRPVSAFTADGINSRIEYIPLSVSRGRFSALVKLQTLHVPFDNNWMLSFQLPYGQSIDNVDSGRIVANGTSVSILPKDSADPLPSMAISITVRGRYSWPYRIPDLTIAKVSLH